MTRSLQTKILEFYSKKKKYYSKMHNFFFQNFLVGMPPDSLVRVKSFKCLWLKNGSKMHNFESIFHRFFPGGGIAPNPPNMIRGLQTNVLSFYCRKNGSKMHNFESIFLNFPSRVIPRQCQPEKRPIRGGFRQFTTFPSYPSCSPP